MAQDVPETLDPALLDDVYESTIVNQLFDGLLTFDSNLNTVPCLAESWIISPDGLRYKFHLAAGLFFHDGHEVTSEDVIYSFTRVFDLPESATILSREFLAHIVGCEDYMAKKSSTITGLIALSRYDVEVTLKDRFGAFLAVVASDPLRIVPKHYVERVGDEAFGIKPVGSGPFELVEWIPNTRITLAAHREYPNPAKLDTLIFEFPGENARDVAAEKFLAGELSAVVVPEDRLKEFREHKHSTLLTRQELSLSFLGLNRRFAPFDSKRVRQAFVKAVDRRAFTDSKVVRLTPNGILPPGMPGYSPESKLLEFDLEESRRLLTQAGYPSGDGLPEIILTTASQTAAGRKLIDSLAAQVARVGFVVRTQRLSWLEFSRRLTARELQCFNVTWVADIPDPDSFLFPIGHKDGSANFANYSNKKVDALLVKGRHSRTSSERMVIYRQVERLILEDAPIVPLFHPLSAIAVQEQIRGVKVTPIGIGNIAMEQVYFIAQTEPHSLQR